MIWCLIPLYTASLFSGYFPNNFKTALITVIPKAAKPPNRLENIRPISLLEIPGKFFEKVINNFLKTH